MDKPTITVRSLKISNRPGGTVTTSTGIDPEPFPAPAWETVQALIDWLDQKYPDGYFLEANIRDEWNPAEARFESDQVKTS